MYNILSKTKINNTRRKMQIESFKCVFDIVDSLHADYLKQRKQVGEETKAGLDFQMNDLNKALTSPRFNDLINY